MDEKKQSGDVVEKRSEPRQDKNKYYSVQFSRPGLSAIYQFKLRDMSSKGLGFLVKEDSAVLGYLKSGDIVDMNYCPADSYELPDVIRTKICHIVKCEANGLKGHYLVGLMILEKIES